MNETWEFSLLNIHKVILYKKFLLFIYLFIFFQVDFICKPSGTG